MNSSYTHLTLSERENIMLMHSQGKIQTEIAQALGRSASTISRELKRYSLAEYRASLVMLTDRKSRFELAKKVVRKKAELVKEAMIGSGQAHMLFI